jgi:hypothetical protein
VLKDNSRVGVEGEGENEEKHNMKKHRIKSFLNNLIQRGAEA